MEITIHLSFPGTCERAFRFYASQLGGEITTLITWGNSPISNMVDPDWCGKVCHATLALGESRIAGVDTQLQEYQRPGGFQLVLKVESAARAEEVFAALAEGGRVTMPISQTFWAERFGIVEDQFGVTWEVQSQVTPTVSLA